MATPETEKALAEALARAEEAERTQQAFLEAITHEFMTPLNAIVGFSDILLGGLSGPLTEVQKRQLESIGRSAKRLTLLVNDTLDFAKGLSGRLETACEEFDLAFVARAVVEELGSEAAGRGLALSLDAAGQGRGRAFGDSSRTRQALRQLVSNAIKFTEKGSVRVRLEDEGDKARVLVVDTGIGIEPGRLPLIWKPFRQLDEGLARHYEGAGLGLALSRLLVEAMGGAMIARSEPGKGSTFGFELPAAPPPR